MNQKARIGLILMVLFALAAPVAAQDYSTAAGRITDMDGAPLPGVLITAVYQPTGMHHTTTSRADGGWLLMGIPVGGPYTLTASLDGYAAATRENVTIKPGRLTTINFQMKPDPH